MAYEIAFQSKVAVNDPDQYINDCCWGGDVIRDRLLPVVSGCFSDIQTGQEDWGWLIWIRKDALLLAIDIYCDDKQAGEYRIHLSARAKKWLILDRQVDAPQLEGVKEMVVREIQRWGSGLKVTKFSPD